MNENQGRKFDRMSRMNIARVAAGSCKIRAENKGSARGWRIRYKSDYAEPIRLA